MNIGILGFGEIGQSIYQIVNNGEHQVFARARHELPQGVRSFEEVDQLDVLHICIPCSEKFIDVVVKTAREMRAKLVTIESTVPVGTTRKIAEQGINVVHSPVRGNHPDLAPSIRTFVKYVGGTTTENTREAKDYYEGFGITVVAFESAEETELAKLLCTTYYGWNIIFCKQVKKICEAFGLDFDHIYRDWNRTYNEGYEAMGRPNVRRPILNYVPGPTGGHCVTNNMKLLGRSLLDNGEYDLTDLIDFFLDHDE